MTVAADDLKAQAADWIARYANAIATDYDTLMDAANAYLDHSEYLSEGGKYESVTLPERFWPMFEAVTGRIVPKDERQSSFFSCSC